MTMSERIFRFSRVVLCSTVTVPADAGRRHKASFVINIMLLARRTLRPLSTVPLSRRCGLSSRASAVLSSLDIPTTPTELPGVYDGEWKGSGDSFQSICPTTGEILAHVKSVNQFFFLLCSVWRPLVEYLFAVNPPTGFAGGV
jgi:hypothetical protein